MAYPTLNANEAYNALYNMIISQQIFDRVSVGDSLVDKARVDGGLYGDQKLFISVDALKSYVWNGDSEAANLLSIDRGPAPETQAVVLNKFRQIRLTLDDFISKRAFMDEGGFAAFHSVIEGMIGKTKAVSDITVYNAFIGTAASTVGKQSPTAWSLTSGKEGQQIAQKIADLVSEMTDVSRAFNDYAQVTKFDKSQIKLIFNSKWVNQIRAIDEPVLFHNGVVKGLIDNADVVNEKYFGDVKAIGDISAATVTTGKPIKVAAGVYTYEPASGETLVLRVLEECELTCTDGTTKVHFYAGEALENPTGKTLVVTPVKDVLYAENAKIIAKVVVELPPYMSSFQASTEFVNPRALCRTRYLTWGHNTLAYLKGYPMITLKSA